MRAPISGAEWLSQQQAADLVGVPVATVEFAARAGKFVKRDRAPSLRRDSVLEWADARRKRKRSAAKRARRPRRGSRAAAPLGPGWVEVGAAAEVLAVSRYTMLRLAAGHNLEKRRSGRQWFLPEDRVRALATERRQWVSIAGAAGIVGCTVHAIEKAVSDGQIRQRNRPRWLPSLNREDVDRYVPRWRAQATAAEKERRRKDAAARSPEAPPNDGDVWLALSTVATMLGISTTRLGQLTHAERIPATRRGRRWWYRRSDIERYAAARAARLSGGATLLGDG